MKKKNKDSKIDFRIEADFKAKLKAKNIDIPKTCREALELALKNSK